MHQLYPEDYYTENEAGIRSSVREMVRVILELIQPKSVVDVGCGYGTWLAGFREYGIDDVIGLDGDWINRDSLKIPRERFLSWDLEKPIQLNREFDLVISLEVAEHLPPASSGSFVDSLTGLGPIVIFSAAIPFQGGVGHINEHWPEYWASLFADSGYKAIDCIRKRIWQNADIQWWYVQNTMMYARTDYLEQSALLRKELDNTSTSQLALVHPRKYLQLQERMQDAESVIGYLGLKKTVQALPRLILAIIRRRLDQLLGPASTN
jgi:SAM-dependent methyltransferase